MRRSQGQSVLASFAVRAAAGILLGIAALAIPGSAQDKAPKPPPIDLPNPPADPLLAPPSGTHPDEPGKPVEPNPAFQSELFGSVADDAPLPPRWLNRDEVLVYEKLIFHAHQMPLETLNNKARRDLTFPLLFGPDRARYRGELVHLEGRLQLLRRMELSNGLKDVADTLQSIYEAWIFLDRYGGVYCCVHFTELPPTLQPGERIDRRVETNAYFFKRLQYETRERTPQGFVSRLAPLLIARTITPLPEPAKIESLWAIPTTVVLGTIAIVGGSLLVWLALVWWFRREDRQVRARLNQVRPGALGSAEMMASPFGEGGLDASGPVPEASDSASGEARGSGGIGPKPSKN